MPEIQPVRLMIVDDHPVVIEGLRSLFCRQSDITLVGSYSDRDALMTALRLEVPDLLLLDIKLRETEGEEVAKELANLYPELKIIVLTYLDSLYYIRMMIKRGVRGYVLKTSGEQTLLDAIYTVQSGEQFIEPSLREKLLEQALFNKKETVHAPMFTRRELEILKLIASNYTSEEIAKKLFIAKRTVQNHRANMLLKLKVKNAPSMIKKAIELDLL